MYSCETMGSQISRFIKKDQKKSADKGKCNEGHHEIQISEDQEDAEGAEGDIDTCRSAARCKKKSGHKKFRPLKEFKLEHLPESQRDPDVYEYIEAAADLTVKVDVKETSPQRQTEEKGPISGTGMIDRVFKYTDGVRQDGAKHRKNYTKCWCKYCKDSNSPNNVWWEIIVLTAAHVVFDDFEASHTKFKLFYDSKDNKIIILDNVIIDYVNSELDKCKLICAKCDKNKVTCVKNVITSDKEVERCDENPLKYETNVVACDRNVATNDKTGITWDLQVGTPDKNMLSSNKMCTVTCNKNTVTFDENIEICDKNTVTTDENIKICDKNTVTIDENIEICDKNTVTFDENIEICDKNTVPIDENIEICDKNTVPIDENIAICDKNTVTIDENIAICDQNTSTFDENIEICDKNGVTRNKQMMTTDKDKDTCYIHLVSCGENVTSCDKNLDTNDINLVTYDKNGMTDDNNVGEKLKEMLKRYEAISRQVFHKYENSSIVDSLTFIVSHPHGCYKMVSVGQCLNKYKAREYERKFLYTAYTCPGSSGARVHCVGYRKMWGRSTNNLFVHSGTNTKRKYNYSGVGRSH